MTTPTDYAQRDRKILTDFDQLLPIIGQSKIVHQMLGRQHGISASRIRHIIFDERQRVALNPVSTNLSDRLRGHSAPDLPLDAVPNGFSVKRLNTRVDADGDTQEQWLRSDVASLRTTDIQDAVPTGHRVKGVSTYIDERGNVRGQWIKTDQKQQEWLDIVNGVLKELPAIVAKPMPPIYPTLATENDLLALYPLADLHLGLYASSFDAERDWNLDMAVETFTTCIDDLVSRTPPAKEAIIAGIGDYTHIDNLVNRTPNSGAALDASGRMGEIALAAMRLLVYAINRVAEHHAHVTVIWKSGNHDEATALVFLAALVEMYRASKHIDVIVSGKRTECVRHGQVALGFAHGDTDKRQNLPLTMANDYPEIWAATRYRVFHVGHIHHKTIIDERVGCLVESHQSPAPGDAYHNRHGYRSLHSMVSIIYDTIGEYARNTVQVRALLPKGDEPKESDFKTEEQQAA